MEQKDINKVCDASLKALKTKYHINKKSDPRLIECFQGVETSIKALYASNPN